MLPVGGIYEVAIATDIDTAVYRKVPSAEVLAHVVLISAAHFS